MLIPPHQPPAVVKKSGLGNEAGWIPVDRNTFQTKFENIYAVGDVTAVSLPGKWKPDQPLPLPKAGVFAHAEGKAAARRIAAKILGKNPVEIFQGIGYCSLEAGRGTAGFAFGNFYAEPSPEVRLKPVGRLWHWGKVLFEKWWLSPPGFRKALLKKAVELGGKLTGVPSDL